MHFPRSQSHLSGKSAKNIFSKSLSRSESNDYSGVHPAAPLWKLDDSGDDYVSTIDELDEDILDNTSVLRYNIYEPANLNGVRIECLSLGMIIESILIDHYPKVK